MKPRKYYAMEANEETRTAQVVIFGDITSWPWLESDVSAYNLCNEIQALDVDAIDVHINSYGGEVAEALAITNTLRRHQAKVKTYADGFVCSAATIIFMAGDERIVSPASNFLVHPASAYVGGNATQLRKEADNLDAITEQSVNMYMLGVTKSKEELLSLMDEERFLTPEEVLEWGFATKIDDFGEEENPTQSVRELVNERIRSANSAVRMEERQIEELRDSFREQMDAFKAEVMQALEAKPKEEPPKTEPKQQSMMEKFLSAF